MAISSAPLADPGVRRAASRFLVAGGLNAALNYVLFRGLLAVLDGRPGAAGLAQGVAYAIGVAVGYVVNRRWTFGAGEGPGHAHGRALPRFLAAYGVTLVVGAGLVEAGVRAGLGPTTSWVLATGVTTVLNFVAQRFWVFPEGGAR